MSQKPSLTIRRHIKAPPARIFAAWTEPAQLARWFGSTGSEVKSAALDARAGHRYNIVFSAADGEEHGVGGIYREVVPNKKLVFTWAWRSTPERESLVTLTFEPESGGTLFTLLHEQFFDEAARDRHREGWGGFIEKLASYAEAMQP